MVIFNLFQYFGADSIYKKLFVPNLSSIVDIYVNKSFIPDLRNGFPKEQQWLIVSECTVSNLIETQGYISGN